MSDYQSTSSFDTRGRFMTMSAICALIALRTYRSNYPTLGNAEVISTLRTHFFDLAHFDYGCAEELDSLIPAVPLAPSQAAVRAILTALIYVLQPRWLRLAPLGRERIVAVLAPDQQQCLVSAGLLAAEPGDDVVDWWDALASLTRLEQDDNRLVVGRKAERLTLAYERGRLRRIGIDRTPRWSAIENNTLGYDVLSYSPGPVEPTHRLIEVKGASSYPLSFHLTRHEWEVAMAAKGSYVFHVWHLPSETLFEICPDEMMSHVPENRGEGHWESALIVLSDITAC